MSYDLEEKSRFDARPVECYFFELGTSSWSYTSAEESVTIPGWEDPFLPAPIIAERQEHGAEDAAGGIVLTVPRTLECIADFVAYAPPTRVSLILIQAHRNALSEYKTPFRGAIVGVEWEDALAKLRCQPIIHEFGRVVPRISYQRQCNWSLYSAGCGVNASAFDQQGVVTSILGSVISATAWGGYDDGWFNAGFALWGSQRRFIVAHVGQALTLMNPFNGLEVGLTVTAYAGCDLTETTCDQKFDNRDRHLGFARVPYRNPHIRRAW